VDVLALGRNNEEYHTEKVVVITGPTLGSSLKLIIFGALLGAAGTIYCQRQQEEDALHVRDQKDKAKHLLQRASNLAMRTKDLAQTVTQSLMPQWQDALETAKSTAAETEHELHRNIDDQS
jgi:hypothetical protein